MVTATAKWDRELRFEGVADTAYTVMMDGDSKVANSPMQLVLIASAAALPSMWSTSCKRSASRSPPWK